MASGEVLAARQAAIYWAVWRWAEETPFRSLSPIEEDTSATASWPHGPIPWLAGCGT